MDLTYIAVPSCSCGFAKIQGLGRTSAMVSIRAPFMTFTFTHLDSVDLAPTPQPLLPPLASVLTRSSN